MLKVRRLGSGFVLGSSGSNARRVWPRIPRTSGPVLTMFGLTVRATRLIGLVGNRRMRDFAMQRVSHRTRFYGDKLCRTIQNGGEPVSFGQSASPRNNAPTRKSQLGSRYTLHPQGSDRVWTPRQTPAPHAGEIHVLARIEAVVQVQSQSLLCTWMAARGVGVGGRD